MLEDERKALIMEALEKGLRNRENPEQFVSGDSRLNAHVYKKFLFPYNCLDYVRDVLPDPARNYTIYFVLSCGRKEITSYKVHNEYIDINYCDIENGKTGQVILDLKEKVCQDPVLLRCLYPFFEYEICKSGSSFRVFISPEHMKQIEKMWPAIYQVFPEECKKSGIYYAEYELYHLIEEDRKRKDETEEYDLLYIGKSNAKESNYDILERLNSHKTIQKIIREGNLYYRSKELMIMIFSFASKLYRQCDLKEQGLNVLMGDSFWEEAKLLTNIEEHQEMILLLESILINHFKPKYNKQYTEKISIKSKIYEEFKRQNINPVSIELDLSMDYGKMRLKTRETETTTKMRNLFCYEKNNKIVTECEDMTDILYDYFTELT